MIRDMLESFLELKQGWVKVIELQVHFRFFFQVPLECW